MASTFRFEFLFEPNTLDTVGTQTPRWQSYVGTREGPTAENAAGWVDCTGETWFTIVGEDHQTESWTADGLYVNDEGKAFYPDPPLWYVDSVTLIPTDAFLALGTPTALKARIVTELPASNAYGNTTGAVSAVDVLDYPFASATFTFVQMHGIWKLADLRSADTGFEYLTCSAPSNRSTDPFRRHHGDE